VTRYVNETDAKIVELEIGKTEIDSYAATFLFGQAIRIGAGQSAHEGTLPVIDVTCCANNQRRHVSHGLHGPFRNHLFVEFNVLRNDDVCAIPRNRGIARALAHLASQLVVS